MQQTKVLADRSFPRENFTSDVLRILAANVLMILCAQIAIPLPWTPVPITGQTFGVLLVAVLLGSRRGALALGLYLLEGAAGFPVFQPFGMPGPARFFGPTAGYLLSYPVAAYFTGWLIERGAAKNFFRLCGALVAGDALIFIGGCSWLAASLHLGGAAVLSQGAVPFLPGEVLKIALILAAIRGVQLAKTKRVAAGA
ncbi:MAG TPA: biotin transporter BioY [Candidatus Acidoferrum sp.]|nr:biotin transporter BioY [Candidatus Acidoferrum sp.]